MKNLLSVVLLLISYNIFAQIECIQCFHQNDPISPDASNLIQNGGFEDHNCVPEWFAGSFCPGSNLYNCDIENWRCIGGGVNSYPTIFDTTLSLIPEGEFAAYFGNGNGFVCAEFSFDTSCLVREDCTINGFPPGLPTTLDGYGGTEGVSLEQTVENLIVGETYILEFWAGGEPLEGLLLSPGVFAIDIGFGKTFLTYEPTEHNVSTGTVYLVRFAATSPTHTFTFTNWGHMCIDCTELVIDNVKLYTLAELSPTAGDCTTALSEISPNDQVKIYPNPAKSSISIDIADVDIQMIRIFDAHGNEVLMQLNNNIDVTGLTGGVYYLSVLVSGKNIVKRFVVVN